MGDRSNRALWTGSLRAFILSQEAELRPRPLGIFPTRGELTYRESSNHWYSVESWTPRIADTTRLTGSQAHRRDRLQSETAKPVSTRDNQMARGKYKNVSDRN